MFNYSLKKILLVFLLLFLTVKATSNQCVISPPSGGVIGGHSNTFGVSNLNVFNGDSYSYYCSQSSSYQTLSNVNSQGTAGTFPCSFASDATSYWVSVNDTTEPNGGYNCTASGAVSSGSGLSVSITSPPSITAGKSVGISGIVTPSSASGLLTLSSTNCSGITVSGSFSGGGLTDASLAAPSGMSSTTCNANISISYDGAQASDVIVFPVIGTQTCTASYKCSGAQACPLTSQSSCTYASPPCPYVINECGYNPSCSLTSNVSSVNSPGGSVAISGVLTGFSQDLNSWNVQCGGTSGSAQGSCSLTKQSSGLYNGDCNAVCSYISTPGVQNNPVTSSVEGSSCQQLVVSVSALSQNASYQPSCSVSIQPTSIQKGSVAVSVQYGGLSSKPSGFVLDCSGGLFSREDVSGVQCSGGYSGSSEGYTGSCTGSCSYNTTLSQQSVSLNVNVGGASCNVLLTWLASVSQPNQGSSQTSSQANSSAPLLNVSIISNSFNESSIISTQVLGLSGVFNSTLPVDSLACVSPAGAGSCSCSVSGSNFNCVFQPTVNGSYDLVFKSGLSSFNQNVSLIPGQSGAFITNVMPSSLFDAVVGVIAWIKNPPLWFFIAITIVVLFVILLFLFLSWFEGFVNPFKFLTGVIAASIYLNRKEGDIKVYDVSSSKGFDRAKTLYSEMRRKDAEWGGKRVFASRLVEKVGFKSRIVRKLVEGKAYKHVLEDDYHHFKDFETVSFDKVFYIAERLHKEFKVFNKPLDIEDLEGYISKIFDEMYEEQEKQKS